MTNVLVIGAGMYVCGRGTAGYGTVLPTLIQAQQEGEIGEIWVAATRPESVQALRQKLQELAARFGASAAVRIVPEGRRADPQAYRSALAQLAQPACAIVVVPDHLHAAVGADVIRAGLHLLMVKPLAPTLAEGREMVELLEAHQVYGAVDFHKRFDEANLLLRRTIDDGQLGELRHVAVRYSQRRLIRQLFASWIEHTNVFQYLGVHYVDLIYFLTGARPVRVQAVGQPPAEPGADPGRFDAIHAVVEWKDPALTSSLATSWADPDRSPAMSDQAITVVGTRGRYESDQMRRGVQLVTDEHGLEEVNPYFSQVYRDAAGRMGIHGYGPRSIRQFLADVQGLINGTQRLSELSAQRPSFQQALVSTAVIEAAGRSAAAGGEWMAVDDGWQRAEAASHAPREVSHR